MVLILDTLVFAQRLRKAGVPQDQAEAHADVTRDLVLADIASRDEMKSEFAQLRSELKAFEETLINRVTKLVTTILISVITVAGVLVALFANLGKLIGH